MYCSSRSPGLDTEIISRDPAPDPVDTGNAVGMSNCATVHPLRTKAVILLAES